MSIRLVLMSFSCLEVVGCCPNNAKLTLPQLTQNIKHLTEQLTIVKESGNRNIKLDNSSTN